MSNLKTATEAMKQLRDDLMTWSTNRLDTKANKSDIVQSDWDENDQSSNAYIKNKPFGENSNKIYVIEEQTANVINNGGLQYMANFLYSNNWSGSFVIGQKYTVELDGVAYDVIATNSSELGNMGGSSGPVFTEYPFAIRIYNGIDIFSNIQYTKVSIYFEGTELKQLDEKFIPDTIARVGDIETFVQNNLVITDEDIPGTIAREADKLDKPSGASVDQMVVVKTVNENGTVEELETVDRTHGDFIEYTKREHNFPMNITFSKTHSLSGFPEWHGYVSCLASSGDYIFIFDGKEYLVYVDEIRDSYTFGNAAYVETDQTTFLVTNSGEELMVVDMNDVMDGKTISFASYYADKRIYVKQLDEKFIPDIIARTNHVHSWNDLEDKPFYESAISESIIEGDYTFSSASGGVPAKFDAIGPKSLLQVGGQYVVTIESTVYPQAVAEDTNGTIGFITTDGNTKIRVINGPYYIRLEDMNYSQMSGQQVHLKIERQEGGIQHLDEKFIPDTIARIEQVAQSDWNETDDVSPAYIKNKPFYVSESLELITEGDVIANARSGQNPISLVELNEKVNIDYSEIEFDTGVKSDGEIVDLSTYQLKTDNNLSTTDKTVVGAINELSREIANLKALLVDGNEVEY